MVPEHLTEWLGLPVQDFHKIGGEPDFGGTIYRFRYDWDNEESIPEEMLDGFLADPRCEAARGIIIGLPGDSADTTGELGDKVVAAKGRLPNLRGLFVGEMDQEESEISWIEQGDSTAILDAFPALEDLRVRGVRQRLQPVRHSRLKKLIYESGGLPSEILRSLAHSDLPELEHLELWLGVDEYGWDGAIDDVRPLLLNNPFPKLKYLGLRNSEIADEIAMVAAGAPVLDQLETLDLSLGTIRDEGGSALLASGRIRQLKRLDLHHHYMSEDLVRRWGQTGVNVDVSDRCDPDVYNGEVYYYTSVGE